MNNNILDPTMPNSENNVDLGNGQLVSMKTVQQIYSEITGSTESLEKAYKINHFIGFDDLCQLEAKINQTQEQYHIISKNCSITLFHLDDQRQVFSSFERFKIFDRTTLSPVENIRIEYNFLIVLPQLKKPQSYKIEINIRSRAAMIKRANNTNSTRSAIFYEFLTDNTAFLEIDYIDYSVARNFQGVIDGWFRALPEQKSRWIPKLLKKLTGHYIFIFRFTLIAAFLAFCYAHFSEVLSKNTINQITLLQAAIITFGGLTLMSILSGKLGALTSEAIKMVQIKSYINLTRGDEIAFNEMASSNKIS